MHFDVFPSSLWQRVVRVRRAVPRLAVQAAGLAGLAIDAGRVLLLEPEQTRALVAQFGLFLIAQEI